MIKFKAGQQVRVISLKRNGIVISVSSSNSIKVSIGDLQMTCKPSDLENISAANKKIPEVKRKISFQKTRTKVPSSLDLHGHNSADAKEALLRFISSAVVAGHKQLSIIHGHGSGIIKKLVHTTLAEMEVVASFRHPIGNTAETKVYLN